MNSRALLLYFIDNVQQQSQSQLNEIKQAIELMNNVEFKEAKQVFKEAFNWYQREEYEHFKQNIIKAYDLCRTATHKLSKLDYLAYCYLMYVYCAFLNYSEFGNSFINGLWGVHDVLEAFYHNVEAKIRAAIKKCIQ